MIGAIVVLFNPDFNVTSKALESLIQQVDKVCVVDNSLSDNSIQLKRFKNIEYIPLRKNIGIAAAQNIGIDYFIKENYDYVVFSDQDSITPIGVVSKLFKAFVALEKHGYKVAATGTMAINRQTGLSYPIKTKKISIISKDSVGYTSDITECYSVRSSISMVSIDSFVKIGGFDESLFIDGVDHEWCWRAWHQAQLRSFIVEDAVISHQLGEGDRKFASKEIAISSPFRVYYQFRNYLWLSRRNYVPLFWKKKHLIKYTIKFFYFPLFVSPRFKYLNSIINGIFDGLFKYNKYYSTHIFKNSK